MRRLAALGVAGLAAGCALQHVDPTSIRDAVEAVRVVHMTPDRARALSVLAMEELGFELFEAGAGHVRAKSREIAVPEFCTCGSFRGVSVDRRVLGVLLVEVEPIDGESTRLDVQNLCSYRSHRGPVQCTSSGLVELDFWDEFLETAGRGESRDGT